jgi:transcriptional regulator
MTSVDATSIYGTLNLMILRALAEGELHGLAIQRRIEGDTEGRVKVEVGALYPALHRLERDGLLEASWGVADTKRRARFYTLTARGRERLQREASAWMDHVSAVARLLGVGAPAHKARP